MSVENLKSILLFCLIISSLLLSLAMWNYQPDFDTVQSEDRVIDAQLDGKTMTKKDVIEPLQIIFHTGDDVPVGLADHQRAEELYQSMLEWSLYNFELERVQENEWVGKSDQLELIFPTDIPAELIDDLFSVDSERENELIGRSFNRLIVSLGDSEQGYHVLFVNTNDGVALKASMQNISQESERLMNYLTDAQFITYEVYNNSQGAPIYLPNDTKRNPLLFSYIMLPIDPFRNLLFNNPSNVRSSLTSGNTVYTDGTREMVRSMLNVAFTNMTNEAILDETPLTEYQLLDQVQHFMNAHNGFTYQEPFRYFLSDIVSNHLESSVEYTLSYNGMPIFRKEEITQIRINWHNQSVYQYSHPLVQLIDQRGIDPTANPIPSAEQVIDILESDLYQGSTVYNVILGYKVEEQTGGSGQVYKLTPTWYVKGVRGWQPLFIPEEDVGGENNAMGSD